MSPPTAHLLSSLTATIYTLALYTVYTGTEPVDPSLKAGPCPSPPPASDFDPTKLVGRWLDTISTYELTRKAEANRRRCIENFIALDPYDGGLLINTTYLDLAGDAFTLYKKFVPVEGSPGKYTTRIFTLKGWQNHHWVYTFLSFEGESFIEFGCKMFGETHREFHRIRSQSAPVPQEIVDKLIAVARSHGDDRPIFEYDQENCNSVQDDLAEGEKEQEKDTAAI